MNKIKKIYRQIKGFTLTEVIVTMSLFILMSGIGVGVYFQYYTLSLANGDMNNALTLIKQARFRALKNPTNSDYGIHIDSADQTLTSFRNTYVPDDTENVVLKLEQLGILDLSLNPGIGVTDEIVFQKQTGKTQNSGSFTIGNNNFNYTFTINSQGVVN